MNEHEECGMLIKQINDQLEKDANNALRSEDLTLIQASVLLELEQRDHQTAASSFFRPPPSCGAFHIALFLSRSSSCGPA